MPDQPDDPIHYEMKIPPDPKTTALHKDEQQSGSDEATSESDQQENRNRESSGTPTNPPQSPGR